jgi:hypothetical protein
VSIAVQAGSQSGRQVSPERAQGRFRGADQIAGQRQQQSGGRLHITGKGSRPGDREVGQLSVTGDRAEQPALADAGLARDEQHVPGTRGGLGQPSPGHAEEVVPADQDR